MNIFDMGFSGFGGFSSEGGVPAQIQG